MWAYYEAGLDGALRIAQDVLAGQSTSMLWLLGLAVLTPAFLLVGRRPRQARRRQRALSRYRRGHSRQMTFRRHSLWRQEALDVLRAFSEGEVHTGQCFSRLLGMNPYAFEYLVIEVFRQRGCDTRKLKRASGDGGIDGLVYLQGRWHLIQAKRYQGAVSQPLVDDFIALCRRKRMPGLFVATSGFTRGATNSADACAAVQLVNIRTLLS